MTVSRKIAHKSHTRMEFLKTGKLWWPVSKITLNTERKGENHSKHWVVLNDGWSLVRGSFAWISKQTSLQQMWLIRQPGWKCWFCLAGKEKYKTCKDFCQASVVYKQRTPFFSTQYTESGSLHTVMCTCKGMFWEPQLPVINSFTDTCSAFRVSHWGMQLQLEWFALGQWP